MRGRPARARLRESMMRFRAVKGMNDILPEEVVRWQNLEREFRATVALYGYEEIRTPLVEESGLFIRSIGESTDVVDKEMYSFTRHDQSLTLRPEGTAGAARAYVEHARNNREPVTRWFYIGPMFRAERPQRGRYRQFHQAGCEIYGDKGPIADAEMIAMLCHFFTKLGVMNLRVAINSLGGNAARERYHQLLVEYFTARQSALSPHAQLRLTQNPLRILDSKDPRDQELSREAPSILEVLEGDDLDHFTRLRSSLDALGVNYEVDPRLVRGLDYYTRTLFEISAASGELGTQNALCGGGRYDEMIGGLGGPKVPAVGFALGIERLLLAMPESTPSPPCPVFFAPLGPRAAEIALGFAKSLREAGIRVEVDGRGNSLKSLLRRADGLTCRFVVVLGESELSAEQAQLKDLVNHEQLLIPFTTLVTELRERVLSAKGGVS